MAFRKSDHPSPDQTMVGNVLMIHKYRLGLSVTWIDCPDTCTCKEICVKVSSFHTFASASSLADLHLST